ncbi:MAG: hypothetical protein H6551_10255 [Chitinophagales bacterium]|nr:hypothetical protein [Chitinophagaceae bacterium]MCB9065509.1 hypothetical protein [Chitinophagales bacterium]
MKNVFLAILHVIILGMIIPNACYAKSQTREQALSTIDSLKSKLSQSKEDMSTVSLYAELSMIYAMKHKFGIISIDTAKLYAKKAIELAERKNRSAGLAYGYKAIANIYLSLDKNDSAIYYGKKAIEYIKDNEGLPNQQSIYYTLGGAYINSDEFAESRKYYLKALAIAEKRDDNMAQMDLLNRVAGTYLNENKFEAALEYAFKTVRLGLETNNEDKVVLAYYNISGIYSQIDDLEKEKVYALKTLEGTLKSGSKPLLMRAYESLGDILGNEKKTDSAIYYYEKALDLARELQRNDAMLTIYSSLGIVLMNDSQFERALNIFEKLLNESRQAGEDYYEAWANRLIGMAYLHQSTENSANPGLSNNDKQNIRKSIPYFNKSLIYFEEIKDNYSLSITYEQLSQAYYILGDYKQAYSSYVKFKTHSDSLTSVEQSKAIAELEAKANYDRKYIADSIQNAEAQKIVELKLQRQRTMTYSGIGAAILLLAFSIFIFRNNKKLGIEKEKSETLLHNILPEEIADELKDRGATTAQHFDQVTVLFTDFVNFTTAGERMGSQGLVEELHECFKAFDEIMEKYGIEKIKTIGDAYLAVCGLPTSDEQHAEKIVTAAQEIRAFMLQRREQLGDKTFEVRIGVHSGSVVAGIVGVKKFAYDIWGDTVNTAARMEQNSEAGKINISQTTYELVQNKFTCTYRGELEAKNKGKLKMYFVEV